MGRHIEILRNLDDRKRYFPNVSGLPDYSKGNDERYPGINICRVNTRRGYCLPWRGIYVPKTASEAYVQHEYGHYLQYRHWGALYYYEVIIKSLWSVMCFNNDYRHMRIAVELEANTMAHDFFGPNSCLNNSAYPTYYNYKPTQAL